MAGGIEENVHVTITAADAAVSQQAFNKMLFAAYHTVGPELILDYSDPDEAASDFAAWPSVLEAIDAFFGQNPHPSVMSIGRLTTARAKIFTAAPTAANGQAYTVSVNGTEFTYTGDGTATAQEIVEGLKTLIDAASISGLTVTEDNTTLTLTSSAGVWFSFSVARPDLWTVAETTSGTGLGTELSAIATERDDWYGLTCEHQSESVIAAVSAWAEARTKVYGAFCPNTDVAGSGSTDAASDAQTSAYNRTFVRFSPTASEDFPEICLMSSRFPNDPGSETWHFKQVAGATSTTLTSTQVTNLKNKNSGAIRTKGGLVLNDGSKMASGRYIDLQMGMDWFTARLEEEYFTLLANASKVPYTDEGLAMLEGVARSVQAQAVRTGFLADDDNLTVTITPVTEQASADRAARTVRGVVVRGRFAGAVEDIYVTGRLFP